MACNYYMNMQLIYLELINDNISKIESDSTWSKCSNFLDNNLFHQNMKSIFIVVSSLIAYMESTINTLISLKIRTNNLYSSINFKDNLEAKIEKIFKIENLDLSKVKSSHFYGTYKEIVNIRNELIHYKDSNIGLGPGVLKIQVNNHIYNKRKLAFLNQKKIRDYENNILRLVELILGQVGFKINNKCQFIEADGIDDIRVHYIIPSDYELKL